MPTLTGSDFATYTVNDTGLAAARAERIIDRAINLLVLYGEDVNIQNMQGTEGSKTLSVSQKKQGAIELVARAIYASFEKNAANNQTASVGGVNISVADLMSNPEVLRSVKEAAQLLRERDWSRAII